MNPADWAELKFLAQRLLASRRGGEEYRQSSCNGKARFTSHGDASQAIRGDMRGNCRPYHCGACGGWHVGDQTQHRRKLKAMRRFHLRRAAA